MPVTFCEYRRMGFSLIEKGEFTRFCVAAERAVKRHTFGRMGGKLTKEEKYAVCEIADIICEDAKNGRLTGFSNDGYQEHYTSDGTAGRIEGVINTYFGRGDVFRGVKSDVRHERGERDA